MNLFIQPLDVLMFRDGKPFSAGDDHFARSMAFPPSPTTFYGALRSKILSEVYPEYDTYGELREGQPIPKVAESLTKEIGTPDKASGSLRITAFLIGKRNGNSIEPYFPIPQDIVKAKGQDGPKFHLLAPTKNLPALNNAPINMVPLWCRTEDALENVYGFLNLPQMRCYLSGSPPTEGWGNIIEGERVSLIYKKEERTGIQKRRESRTASEGALYSVEYIRLAQDVGFFLTVDGSKLLPTDGRQLLRLGGDWRSAFYEEVPDFTLETDFIRREIELTRRFKLILTTSAVFHKGWLPSFIDGKTQEADRNGLKLKLVSVALGKPIGIGGFNLVERKPKPMKKAVPAGSVYFFELIEGSVEQLFLTFDRKAISDENDDAGLGVTLIGGWSYV